MKRSIYNSEVTLSDNCSLLYKALTDSFVLIKRDLNNLLENGNQNGLQKFKDEGFLVDESVDEKSILQERLKDRLNNNKEFRLIVNPTLECNFSCWYCYEEKKKGTLMSQGTIDSLCKFIRDVMKRFRRLHLSFFGGEPLLAFDTVILPILQAVKHYSTALCVICSSSPAFQDWLFPMSVIFGRKTLSWKKANTASRADE